MKNKLLFWGWNPYHLWLNFSAAKLALKAYIAIGKPLFYTCNLWMYIPDNQYVFKMEICNRAIFPCNGTISLCKAYLSARRWCRMLRGHLSFCAHWFCTYVRCKHSASISRLSLRFWIRQPAGNTVVFLFRWGRDGFSPTKNGNCRMKCRCGCKTVPIA